MTHQELIARAQEGLIDALNLISVETGFYMLEILSQGQRHSLSNESGQTLRLHSIEQARELLQLLPEDLPFHLVHNSAYDEMCGLPEGRRDPLRVPLSLHSPWPL